MNERRHLLHEEGMGFIQFQPLDLVELVNDGTGLTFVIHNKVEKTGYAGFVEWPSYASNDRWDFERIPPTNLHDLELLLLQVLGDQDWWPGEPRKHSFYGFGNRVCDFNALGNDVLEIVIQNRPSLKVRTAERLMAKGLAPLARTNVANLAFAQAEARKRMIEGYVGMWGMEQEDIHLDLEPTYPGAGMPESEGRGVFGDYHHFFDAPTGRFWQEWAPIPLQEMANGLSQTRDPTLALRIHAGYASATLSLRNALRPRINRMLGRTGHRLSPPMSEPKMLPWNDKTAPDDYAMKE